MISLVARSLTVVAAAGTLAAVAPATAQAGPTSCPAKVTVPNIKITSTAGRTVPMTLTQTCGAWAAAWMLRDSTGKFDVSQGSNVDLDGALTFPLSVDIDPTRPLVAGVSQPVRIKHRNPLGTQTMVGTGAWKPNPAGADQDWLPVQVASTPFQVKLGATATMKVVRSGTKITVSGTVTRYTPAAGRFTGWRGARVAMQWRPNATSAWRTLIAVRSGVNGAVAPRSWVYAEPSLFRLSVNADSATWSALSPQVRR